MDADLMTFCEQAFSQFVTNWKHEYIETYRDHLERFGFIIIKWFQCLDVLVPSQSLAC